MADLDRKSGSAGMPRPISYAVFCLKKKKNRQIIHIPSRPLAASHGRFSCYHKSSDPPHLHSFPTRRSSDLSSNLSETAEVPACNVPSRSPLPALAIAPETKLGTASSGLGTLEP